MADKITKKMLKDYTKAKLDIPLLRAELNAMNNSEAGLGSSVIMDYSKGFPRPQAVVGFDYERYERKRELLIKKEKLVAAVEEWIGNIEDIQNRTVFTMRYIKGQKWEQISQKMNYKSPDYARIVLHDRYLEKI